MSFLHNRQVKSVETAQVKDNLLRIIEIKKYTQKDLAHDLGCSREKINIAIAGTFASKPLARAAELLLENLKLKAQIEAIRQAQTTLQNLQDYGATALNEAPLTSTDKVADAVAAATTYARQKQLRQRRPKPSGESPAP